MPKKYLIILIIILAVLGVGGYALRPKKIIDEIAGWKIYRNENYKYEVKYPDNWFVVNGEFYQNISEKPDIKIFTNEIKYENKPDLDEIVEDTKYVQSVEKFIVNGLLVARVLTSEDFENFVAYTFFIRNDNLVLTFIEMPSIVDTKIARQVLQTFRFLE